MAVFLGVVAGTVARLMLLRVDYRQYPTYPEAYLSHLAIGVLAAFTGAAVLPALQEHQWTAATFLVLVGQQFTGVRDMERRYLSRIDRVELVPRGPAYIEGMARAFEARNYVVMAVALLTSGVALFSHNPLLALLGGAAVGVLGFVVMRGKTVGDIARVRPGRLEFNGSLLEIEGVVLMDVGLRDAREKWRERGLAVVLEPIDENARDTLASPGQRQAMVHDAAAILGVYIDVDTPELTPLARRDLRSGNVVLAAMLMEPDIGPLLEVVKRTPLLEASVRRPNSVRPGRRAAD